MTETVRVNRVTAVRVMRALADAGILSKDEYIHRVVIDLRAGDVARMYVERYGDTRMIDVLVAAAPSTEISDRPNPWSDEEAAEVAALVEEGIDRDAAIHKVALAREKREGKL